MDPYRAILLFQATQAVCPAQVAWGLASRRRRVLRKAQIVAPKKRLVVGFDRDYYILKTVLVPSELALLVEKRTNAQ